MRKLLLLALFLCLATYSAAQPLGESDPFTIYKDGSSETSALIPFKWGASFGYNSAHLTLVGAATISTASPAVVSITGHGLAVGDIVVFRSTGSLPTPLHPNDLYDGTQEWYFVISDGFTANAFEISLTAGGAALNTTVDGSGIHNLYKVIPNQTKFLDDSELIFDWRKHPKWSTRTLGIRRSSDEYHAYPNYEPRFLVNATASETNYDGVVGFSAWVNNNGTDPGEEYGFWGGCYDQGTNAGPIDVNCIGLNGYNQFTATNSRLIRNTIGIQGSNEISDSVTSTNVKGGAFAACLGGGGTITNTIGLDVTDGGCASTNNYGIKIGDMTNGTTDYAIYTGKGINRFGTALSVEQQGAGSGTAKVGFFGAATVAKQTALTTQLTTVTFTAPGTPDYAWGAGTNSSAWGWSSNDEFKSAASTIANLQTRVAELETRLKNYGLLP